MVLRILEPLIINNPQVVGIAMAPKRKPTEDIGTLPQKRSRKGMTTQPP
jgi:hypothetical protein